MRVIPLVLVGPGCFPTSDVLLFVAPGGIDGTLSERGMAVRRLQDEIGLRTVGYGDQELHPPHLELGCGELDSEVCGAGARLVRPPLEEWWSTGVSGLGHGWLLRRPPTNGGVSVTIEFTDGGLVSVDADGLGATLEGTRGGAWRYDGLTAWDAGGTRLPVRMVADGNTLIVRVDVPVGVASWPVVVDPILSSVYDTKLLASDGQEDDAFGIHVQRAGDINGDGYQDLAVGAPNDDDAGSDAGAAYVFYGSVTGIDGASEVKIIASDARAAAGFGRVAGAGDVDSDGYADLLATAAVSDRRHDAGGAAYIYYGSATGLALPREQVLISSDNAARDYFGVGLDGAGDVDADGYSDVVISTPDTDHHGTDSGSAYVFFGSSSGLAISREQQLHASDAQPDAGFGGVSAGAGDLDADGFDDIAVGASGESTAALYAGAVYVYYGASSGIDPARETKLLASDAARIDVFGVWVVGGGDIDGDGYSDLAVGAPGDSDGGGYASGSVYVYYGGSTGIVASREDQLLATDSESYDQFASLAGGDFDHDGYADLAVGAYGNDDLGARSGAAYVYYGSASGIDQASESKLVPSDGDDDDLFGYSLTGGDFDGDLFDDLVVSAYKDDDRALDAGSVYVFTGSCRDDEDGDGSCAESDCDDADPDVNPSAREVCDGVDNDCDGVADDNAEDAEIWYLDADGDGYGDETTPVTACTPPLGYVADSTDCDDHNPSANPSATELCDGFDNDCDGRTDEDDAADASTWYADADGDGFGNAASTDTACSAPFGSVANDTDCDDNDASVNPDAEELWYDGIDQDCDGRDDDQDGDGASMADDCDDLDSTIITGCEEVENGQHCDGCGATSALGSWSIVALAALACGRRRGQLAEVQ